MRLGTASFALLLTLGVGAAGAQTIAAAQAVEQIIQRNAAGQARIAGALARGTLDARVADELEVRQARVYRMESLALGHGASARELDGVAQAQAHVFGDVAGPGARLARPARERMTVQHERVAAMRDAEQQLAIGRGWAEGRLSLDQIARLETGQARLARLQTELTEAGHESVQQALRLSHLQDVQDWAIARARPSL